MAEIDLTTAAAGNPLYMVSSPDGVCLYVTARPRGLEKRLRKAAERIDRDYAERKRAIAKATGTETTEPA